MGPGFRRDDKLLIGFNAFFGTSRHLIEAEMCESDSGETWDDGREGEANHLICNLHWGFCGQTMRE